MSQIPLTFKIKVKILKTNYVRPFLWVNRQTADQSEDYNKCGVFIEYAGAVCVCVYFCVFLFVRVSLSGQWCWLWCNRATDQPLLLITWRELQSINTTLSQMLQCAIVAVLYIWPLQRMWPKCDQRDLNVWMMKCLPHHCWSPCAICIVHCVIHCAICIVHYAIGNRQCAIYIVQYALCNMQQIRAITRNGEAATITSRSNVKA